MCIIQAKKGHLAYAYTLTIHQMRPVRSIYFMNAGKLYLHRGHEPCLSVWRLALARRCLACRSLGGRQGRCRRR